MATQLIEIPGERPWPFQPQRPVKIARSSGLRPEFCYLGGQMADMARPGMVWTPASGAAPAAGACGRGYSFTSSSANGLTRANATKTAQTKVTFVAIYHRTANNAFAEVLGTSSNGTGFGLGFDGGALSIGLTKLGVISLTFITPTNLGPVCVICSHDQATGEYWIMSADLFADNAVISATQTQTSASSAPNGTVSVNRNGGANTFGGTVFLGICAYQFMPRAWGLKYIRKPWSLFEPLSTSIWLPQEVGGASIVGPLVGSRHLASNGPLISGRLAA